VSTSEYRVWTDGASRGNPGAASLGVSIRDSHDQEVATASETIGRATNNVAEYRALLKALELLRGLGATRARFYLDSQLIVRQMNGEYRIKDPKMRALSLEVFRGLRKLESFSFHHVPRAENRRADALANLALDRA
jgi:ribonuclease HI